MTAVSLLREALGLEAHSVRSAPRLTQERCLDKTRKRLLSRFPDKMPKVDLNAWNDSISSKVIRKFCLCESIGSCILDRFRWRERPERRDDQCQRIEYVCELEAQLESCLHSNVQVLDFVARVRSNRQGSGRSETDDSYFILALTVYRQTKFLSPISPGKLVVERQQEKAVLEGTEKTIQDGGDSCS